MEWFDTLQAEWSDAVARWQAAVKDYFNAFNILLANKSKAEALGPDELARWQEHYNYAQSVQSAIQSLQDTLGSASNWLSDTFGLSAIKRGMGSLGAAGLVPVAVIVGSIATLGTVTYSLYSYNAELERKWNYIQGRPDITPGEVADVLDSGPLGAGGIPVLSEVKSIATWVVIGGLLLYFGPGLIKSLKAAQ